MAYFGFFELTETGCFSELWHFLLKEAKNKGIEKIFGPVNGTIWHPYRLIAETSPEPFFTYEPPSSTAYYKLFNGSAPLDVIEFHSGYRTNYELILEQTKNSVEILKKAGVTILRVNYSPQVLKEIFELSIAIFSQSPGFYPLSFEDFSKLYAVENDNQWIIRRKPCQ